MRRIVSSLIVILLSLSLSVFALNVQPAKAQSGGTIYIYPDGTISSPVPANITTTDSVTYTFNGSNYLPIVVERSDITINGAGYMLKGDGSGNGTCCNSTNNVTVENLDIENFLNGIYVENSTYSRIIGSSITASYYGVYLALSSNSTITRNNITSFSFGVCINLNSVNNTISENSITGGFEGVSVQGSYSNTISKNNITESLDYGVILNIASNNTISQNNIAGSYGGLDLGGSLNNSISANSITNNSYGISLQTSSDHNTVSANVFTNNGLYVTTQSFHNVVQDNFVNGKPLVYLEDASHQAVSDAGQVVLVNCTSIAIDNVNLSNVGIGLELYQTDNTTITNSNITNNTIWGAIFTESSNNVISGNNVTNNSEAFALYSSSNNTFFHNNFIKNTAPEYSISSTSVWDDGYPSGGNYWGSNYLGVDQKSGPYQNVTGSDGIGDTPYINHSHAGTVNITDRYPLMGPFRTFPVPFVPYNVDIVSNSTSIVDFGSEFILSYPSGRIFYFKVTGTTGTPGFCRVDIPLSLIVEDWTLTVAVAGNLVPFNTTTDSNYIYIYFTYTQNSTETVQIANLYYVPEFQPSMLLPLFMIITLLGAIAFRKRATKTRCRQA